jgi:hypothetical protein
MTFDEVIQALAAGCDSLAKIRALTGTDGTVTIDQAVANALVAKDARIAELTAQIQVGTPTPPAPTPTPTPSPSPQSTPDEIPGFELIFSDAFDTECAEGDFVRAYGSAGSRIRSAGRTPRRRASTTRASSWYAMA